MSTPALVSVVVPAFNAGHTLLATLESVRAQSYDRFEILVLDDGSSEPVRDLVTSLGDPRIQYRAKENSGVSDTRNEGLAWSSGDYLLFLDADDMLGEHFLDARVRKLGEDTSLGGCASSVLRIDEAGDPLPERPLRSLTTSDEIVHFAPGTVTCPSGYVFRKSVLDGHGIRFSPRLASSADRFFLLQFLQVARIGVVGDAPLLYRVSAASMSHRLSPALVADRERFVEEVRGQALIPRTSRRRFFARQYYTLSASSFHLGTYAPAFRYALRSALLSPATFARLFLA